MRIVFALLLLPFFLASCSSSEVPSSVLSPGKMKPLLYDLMRADELVNMKVLSDTTAKRDSVAQQYYQQVFVVHGISKKEFYESYKYYEAHPDINKILFDSLNAYANRKKTSIEPKH